MSRKNLEINGLIVAIYEIEGNTLFIKVIGKANNNVTDKKYQELLIIDIIKIIEYPLKITIASYLNI